MVNKNNCQFDVDLCLYFKINNAPQLNGDTGYLYCCLADFQNTDELDEAMLDLVRKYVAKALGVEVTDVERVLYKTCEERAVFGESMNLDEEASYFAGMLRGDLCMEFNDMFFMLYKPDNTDGDNDTNGYVFTSVDLFTEMYTLSHECPVAISVFLKLVELMDEKNIAVCDRKTLSDGKMSESSVSKGVAALKKHNFIQVAKSGYLNKYYINPNMIAGKIACKE